MPTFQTAPHPLASVLILSYDNRGMLNDCLLSIARSTDPVTTPYEVIVLLQQTSHESAARFLDNYPGVRGVSVRLNLGFAAGNNYAAQYAKGKYLVFLNDDATTEYGWLEHLVRRAENDCEIGAVGSRIVFPDGNLQEAGAILWSDGSCLPLGRGDERAALSYTYVRDVDYASANGFLIRRDTFEHAGGFDERFFPGYYEDVDLCLTIRHKLAQRVVYEPRSVIVHRESATSGKDPHFRAFLFQHNQSKLSDKWRDVLRRYPVAQPESATAIERAVQRARGNPKRVLVIDDRVPNAGMGSGFGRTAHMLKELSDQRFAVAFAPTDRGYVPLENTLGGCGVDLIAEPLLDHLQRREKRYDVVVISRPHNFRAFYNEIRRAMPDAAVIYDVEALYHKRTLIEAGFEKDPSRRALLEADTDAMLALEVQIAHSADRLVAISESEANWLSSVDGHAPIDFMRPLAPAIQMGPPALERRFGAVFVAGWLAGDSSPNVGALRWYVKEVLPRVRVVLPDFVTTVSGANPPLSVQGMAEAGISLIGFIESVEQLYRSARVAIAPILVGAGVKIKTIEALQYGVPVVATTLGAEGLGLEDNAEIDIADDPAEYAERIIRLATSDDHWLQRRALIAARMADWKNDQRSWRDVVISALCSRVEASRV